MVRLWAALIAVAGVLAVVPQGALAHAVLESTEPLSGRITPLMSLSSVLFPEPLGPIRPMDSPCSTVKDTPARALKVSLISWPFRAATAICFSVRW